MCIATEIGKNATFQEAPGQSKEPEEQLTEVTFAQSKS